MNVKNPPGDIIFVNEKNQLSENNYVSEKSRPRKNYRKNVRIQLGDIIYVNARNQPRKRSKKNVRIQLEKITCVNVRNQQSDYNNVKNLQNQLSASIFHLMRR